MPSRALILSGLVRVRVSLIAREKIYPLHSRFNIANLNFFTNKVAKLTKPRPEIDAQKFFAAGLFFILRRGDEVKLNNKMIREFIGCYVKPMLAKIFAGFIDDDAV
ncbi:MAG: hypothetical protein ABFS09_02695 [Thermodesulfobacteriota bacterium]